MAVPGLPGAAHGQLDGAAPDDVSTSARSPDVEVVAAEATPADSPAGARGVATLRRARRVAGRAARAAGTALVDITTAPVHNATQPHVVRPAVTPLAAPATGTVDATRTVAVPAAGTVAVPAAGTVAVPGTAATDTGTGTGTGEPGLDDVLSIGDGLGEAVTIEGAEPGDKVAAAPPRLRRWFGRGLDVACGAAAFAAGVSVVVQFWGFLTRPLWGDEVWRAYYVSKSGHDFFHSLPTIDAPLPAGFVLVSKASIRLIGNTELALKAPLLCALPLLAFVTYRLARRVAGPVTSLIAGGTVVLDSAVLVYATQYKQYVFEALAATLAVLLFLRATEARRRGSRIRNALGAGCAAVFGSPVIFVLVPLAVGVLVRAVVLAGRRRVGRPDWWRRVGLDGPLVAALIVLPGAIHAATFLRWQGGRVRTAGNLHPWTPFYLPGNDQGHWVWGRLASWVPEFVTQGVPSPPDLNFPGLHRPSHLAVQLITTGLVVGLVAGAAAAYQVVAVRWLLVAIVGTAAVGLLLSAQHVWPFGWARVNIFLIPLLHVLIAAGVTGLLAAARHVRGRWPVRGAVALVAAAALACCTAGAVAAVGFGRGQVGAVRQDVHRTRTLGDMRAIVAHVRTSATAADVAVVPLGGRAFVYYMDDYTGYHAPVSDGARIPARQVFSSGRFDDRTMPAFVKAHPRARHVYVFEQRGISAKVHRDEVFLLGIVGFHPESDYGTPGGLLTVFART